MTHLLDTSAVLAHFLGESGGEEVSTLLAGGPELVCLAAPSWAELERRLAEFIPDRHEADRIFRFYTQSLCSVIAVGSAEALAAIEIRRAASIRLPLIDSLIAGCARAHGLTLVHRDVHLDAVPIGILTSLRLPDKLRD